MSNLNNDTARRLALVEIKSIFLSAQAALTEAMNAAEQRDGESVAVLYELAIYDVLKAANQSEERCRKEPSVIT